MLKADVKFQGNYTMNPINPNLILHKFVGSTFFYGRARTKLEYYSKKGMLSCVNVEMIIKPITIQRKYGKKKEI